MTIKVSTDYRRLDPSEVADFCAAHRDAWKDPAIPRRQWTTVVRGELERFRAGHRQPHFEALLRALKTAGVSETSTVLEVGASSAYYSEVLKIGGVPCHYTALDYSEAYRGLAAELFPGVKFEVGDACALPYMYGAFDVVISGCCIIHIPEYAEAIIEAARVARGYVVFARTPVLSFRETTYLAKQAYGVECLEIHFNSDELLGLFAASGLEVVTAEDVFFDPEGGFGHRTFLCKKAS